MLYTLTLNPSLDYIMEAKALQAGETNRSTRESLRYGGKGINVSAVLSALGVENRAIALVGGETGRLLLSLLEKENIKCEPIFIKGDTRINLKILLESVTELNAVGPAVSEEEREALFAFLDKIGEGDTLVLSGSIPPSLPKDIYARVIDRISQKGARAVLDTSGEALLSALPFHPYLIKPNESELKEAMGTADIEAGARALQKMGAKNVLVSLGADGALLLNEDGSVLRIAAPDGKAKNTVGAGDSMLAGFLTMEREGALASLRYAVAAGSATAFKGALATKDEIETLLQKI